MAGKKSPTKTLRNTYKKKQSKTLKSDSKDSVTPANRTYKDSLFTDLFYSDVTAEENLRSLYNALHPEDQLTGQDVIERKRLENVCWSYL